MTPKQTSVEPVLRSIPPLHDFTARQTGPRRKRFQQRRIIVVGSAQDVPRALEHPAVQAQRFVVDLILTIDAEADQPADISSRLSEPLRQGGIEAMLIAGPVGGAAMRVIADLALLNRCELLAVMPTEVLADHDPVVVWTGDSPVVQLRRTPPRPWHLAAKRVMDIVGASIGLVVATPVIALFAALIRLESPGSPFFSHQRVGYRGRLFMCLKLRTMRQGAEDSLREDPALYEDYRRNHFKIPEHRDPRTTRLGRFLRRTSIDELPQLWNVLRGDMSLVGPRPVVEDELQLYEHAAEVLLTVRPGLTGAWAVNGRHDVGYPERCAIELSYVRNWRLRDDVKIALKTIQVLSVTAMQWPADDLES
jgi:exopolysaccharide production protein ExoY